MGRMPRFVVQVRAGGAAGGADFADEVARFNRLAGLHVDVRQMAVYGAVAVAVAHFHHLAVAVHGAGKLHCAVGGNVHGVAYVAAKIQTVVELAAFAAKRVVPGAEAGGEPALGRAAERYGTGGFEQIFNGLAEFGRVGGGQDAARAAGLADGFAGLGGGGFRDGHVCAALAQVVLQIGHGFFGLGELVELGVYFGGAGFFQVFYLLIERLSLLLLLRKLAVASVVMPTQSQ